MNWRFPWDDDEKGDIEYALNDSDFVKQTLTDLIKALFYPRCRGMYTGWSNRKFLNDPHKDQVCPDFFEKVTRPFCFGTVDCYGDRPQILAMNDLSNVDHKLPVSVNINDRRNSIVTYNSYQTIMGVNSNGYRTMVDYKNCGKEKIIAMDDVKKNKSGSDDDNDGSTKSFDREKKNNVGSDGVKSLTIRGSCCSYTYTNYGLKELQDYIPLSPYECEQVVRAKLKHHQLKNLDKKTVWLQTKSSLKSVVVPTRVELLLLTAV
ncbi:hypothetical protein QVD17_17640 [Tagetes erecta]|uniref:Uncharacterized protein n=1 Tax=Tagetes erecta TaxID=13708 RepID=A0AAD8KZV4_TARER|nr:hypothetical protein QVD17_17640 [Tagetes erecta]